MLLAAITTSGACAVAGDTSGSENEVSRLEMTLTELPGSDTKIWVFPADEIAPEGFPDLASRACGASLVCKVVGWTDAEDAPRNFPWSERSERSLAFTYERNRPESVERSLWDCSRFAQDDPADCLAK